MNYWSGVILAALFVSSVGSVATASSNGDILILGLNQEGQVRSHRISEKVFRYSFGKSLNRLHRRTLKNIDHYKQIAKEFELSRVTVGLKIETEFGVGNALELGTESAFDLRYEPLPKPKSKIGSSFKVQTDSVTER